VLVGAALATVAPWTLRNQLELGSVVPVSTIGWMSLRIGNTIAQDDWMRPDRAALTAFHRRYFSEPDEVARMDLSRREALAAIAGAQPGWAAKKLVRNTAQLFSLDSALFSKLRAGAYGRPSRAVLRAVVAASAFAYVALIVLGSLGAALDANGSRRWLLVGWIAAVVALHVLANASGRYRLPMLPVFALYAAALLVRVWRGELRVAEFSTVRGAVAAAWLVFFGAVALRYEAGYFVGSLWNAPGSSG
jgi:hypothetical protein